MLKWKELKDKGATTHYGKVYRAKVPGGWLVLVSHTEGAGLTFYPDSNHKWDGNSLD